MEWLSEIRKLRKNVPVGIQVARRLLERTGGDVDEAIKLFHIDQINILTAKADVTHQEAENVLLATNYDIAEALRRIDEQRYTLTELILRKNKDAGDALNNIALALNMSGISSVSFGLVLQISNYYRQFYKHLCWFMNGMNMLVGKEWSVGYFLKVIILTSNCKLWGY